MIEKEESRRIRREIRSVLLRIWDPIGIKNEPNAQDEYDGYVGPIFSLLVQHKGDDEVLDYLMWVVNDQMGLASATRQDLVPTVQALRQIPIAESQ